MSHLLQKTRLPLLSTLLLASTSSLAFAAPMPDEATATQLSSQLQDSLQTLMPANLNAPDTKLDFVGTTKVTVQGDGYLLEIPAMHATMPDATADIPAMTGTLTPTDGPGYAFSLNLPSPLLTFSNADEAMTLQAETRSLSGVWQPGLGFLPEAHLALGTISLTDKAQATIMRTNAVKFDSTYTVANTKMDGLASGTLLGLAVFDPATHNRLTSLERVDMTSRTANVDAAAIQNLRTMLQKMNPQNAAAAPQGLLQLASSLQAAMGDGAANVKLTNLMFSYYDANKSPTSWSLPTATMAFESSHNADGTSRISFSYGHDKLTVTPAQTGVIAELLPTRASFGFTFDKMPLSELAKVIAANVPPAPPPAPVPVDGKPAHPAPAPLLSEATHQQVTALITQYKPTLSINNILYGSPAIQSLTTGVFTANTGAKMYMTGASDTRIAGLDAFTAKLGTLAAPPANSTAPQPQADPEAQGLLMMMSMLQGMGQQAEGGLRTYHFEVGADGSAKMNGTDIASLIGMGMNAGSAETAPPAAAPAQAAPRRHK